VARRYAQMNGRFATVVFLALTTGCGYVTAPETHLIPAGYRGDVFIVPGMPSGERPERSEWSIVFRIPPDGILVTQDVPSQGWHLSRFYYVDAANNRQRLLEEPSSVHDTPENRADTTPIVWFQRIGSTEGTDLPCTVHFARYYVGTRADLIARGVNGANAEELRFREYVNKHHVCR
jgi:hypothetical protein